MGDAMTFAISWQWLSASHESPEVGLTSAKLKLLLGQQVITRHVDECSQTVSDEVRLSTYPLALWLASNWWRLRWEPLPPGSPVVSWKMSHEMAAAGYGYLWPRVAFASDGEVIHVWSEPTSADSPQPVRYLSGGYATVAAVEFERAVEHFLEGVLARLDALGVDNTDLHQLWRELGVERTNAALAAYRRLEAIAGFDAGEGPEDILARLEALAPEAGMGAVHELATLCAVIAPEQLLEATTNLARKPGLPARPDQVVTGSGLVESVDQNWPAWVRGKEIALTLRHRLGLDGQPLLDEDLCRLMGVPADRASWPAETEASMPLGLAVREDPVQLNLHLRRRSATGQRFELARLLCDHVTADRADRWLPVTDGKTSRQKLQRAFAAEFLCPVESLKVFLGGDFSDDAIEAAAEYFRVGLRAVQSQLVNNRILPREILMDFEAGIGLPYR